ncbi:maestro heat-like repeat-containing protein family member 1 isoform X1 [Episyrphus balteatus]|uniref:maestro heat-like repeat-containing protein family member 1 isoform X1 n=1 Tax=Episyrphus balteatus TaxID=286459 RepID=UPI00248543A1|nr:maestro heat-like repeat-containing protein family member 1 isoform X1 [Episyrphus balteatus]
MMDSQSSASGGDKTILEGILTNLFDCLSDKDETVRLAVQNSLVKVYEKNPDKCTVILADYRSAHPKLSDQSITILLRVLESVVSSNVSIKAETYQKIVSFAIDELTKSNENVPTIQTHALAILVAIGRQDCKMVMTALIGHAKEGTVLHFMVMQCMGTLATANVSGTLPFIKQILSSILPNMGGIKQDHVKQAHAFAIGRFSEALLEQSSDDKTDSESEVESPDILCSTEISVAYDVLFNQWLQSREPKVCVEILQALSSMYPLLPNEKIQDQSQRLIPSILNLYRRSIERNSVTQFLSSVLRTTIKIQPNILDPIADSLVTSLFDLVCVYPDYEKPQTVKGHYEVLRCLHLLSNVYAAKIMDMLLAHLRNNSERERIKSLLILTHLTNASPENVESKIPGFMEVLKHMILSEKAIKMKMTLLKAIVALAQKSMIKEKEFVWYIVRHSCRYTKINTEHGSAEEHQDFVQSCENSLFMLSSTVGTMDELLKRELLNYYVLLDFSDICSNITKCMASLFAKNPNIEFEVNDEPDDEAGGNTKSKITVPSPETVFARSIALLGNYANIKRISNVLSFLKFYYPHLNPELASLWDKKIPELLLYIGVEKTFYIFLTGFINDTVEFLQRNDENFAERLVNKMSDQMLNYPIQVPVHDFFIPSLSEERGMVLKAIGLTLCHITEQQTVLAKIDMIIGCGKQEKLDKHVTHADYEKKISSAARALGYVSKVHSTLVIKKLSELANLGARKHSTGFFSNLHFMKDTHKEIDMYKTNLLLVKSYGHMMEDDEEGKTQIDDTILSFLIQQITETKDHTMMKVTLRTLLSICNQILRFKEVYTNPLKFRKPMMDAVFSIQIEAPFDELPLLPTILKLGTSFVRIDTDNGGEFDGGIIFEIACKNFFTCARFLRTKFESTEEDNKNSFLAKHLNESLPELNSLVKVIIENDPSPATLDLIISILECWTRDPNSEVRICASHVLNNSLEVYIKSMRLGCEAPSKFNQTGSMLGKIVPRCIDSNATVRQVSVEILQKTLEISCIYETLTIADSSVDWVKEIEMVKENIITDDPKKIYHLAGNIAKIIALRMSNFQYLQFCKTLLNCLKDPEQSSAIGASVVLKFFIQQKGSELFHAIPDLVKDCLTAISDCDISRAKSGAIKAIAALTKHHPKLVCSEILSQQLPFEENVVEYWHTICLDPDLTGLILDNFLGILSSSCLYEPNEGSGDRQKIASVPPFAIFCAMREMFPCKEIHEQLKQKFPEIFTMLLTSLATYTNLAPPMLMAKASPTSGKAPPPPSGKNKFGFIPNKESIKLNPCQIVLETFQAFLKNLEMEQISTVLTVCNNLSTSTDLKNFIELLTPMAIGVSNQFSIGSSSMKQIITALSKYVSSPYDGQRIASIGLYSKLVPLRPCGEISSVIMLHLSSALSDPNPVVRGLSIQGLGYVGYLTEHDIDKYTETAITALLKGIDDTNSDCLINIPLESKRGLSKILQMLPSDRVESFHVSLAIRIRPFFGSNSIEIREAAIILFGDLCESKMGNNDGSMTPNYSSEALKEQLFANFFPLILHLSESEPTIIRACKVTLRKVGALLNAPKVNEMAQKHLIDHGQLNYNVFILDFVKVIAADLPDSIQDFIESCIPKLRSQWPEVRGNAAIIIGILHNYLTEKNQQTESVGNKIAVLLKDENHTVRYKAATALGYFYGEI